jgi:hypothetical protein
MSNPMRTIAAGVTLHVNPLGMNAVPGDLHLKPVPHDRRRA